MSFSYSIGGVADVDQRWNALPEKGKNFCVPASWINWMYYFARRGRLSALPFVNGQANHIRRNIAAMADYMDTDPDDGTSASDGIDGLVDWSGDRNVPFLVWNARATENDNIRYTNIRNLLQMGAHVVVGRGRYSKDSDGRFERIGGHAMSLVGLVRTSAGVITMSVHNPNNTSDGNTQAPKHVQEQTLTEKRRNIEGDHVTILRWGENSVHAPYLCIDGWTAVLPMFALSNVASGALRSYSVDIATGEVSERTFPLPFGSSITDLVLNPSAPFASVIAEGSGEVWTLNLADGTWAKTPGIAGAQRLVYGGRRQRLLVVQGRQVTSFDAAGQQVAVLDAGVELEAITYDAEEDRLISLGNRKLISIDPVSLQVVDQAAAPELAGEGRLALSVDRHNKRVVLSRSGSPEVVSIRWGSLGGTVDRRIRLRSAGASAALHVDHRGRAFVSSNGKIEAFDSDGARQVGSVFDGLAAGPLLKVARNSSPLNRQRSQRKEWRN
jgi:hypothetical protein